MRLERGFVETSLSTSPPASYTLLPGGTSPGDSTQSPVKCQVLVRILIALAIDSMAQPSGRIAVLQVGTASTFAVPRSSASRMPCQFSPAFSHPGTSWGNIQKLPGWSFCTEQTTDAKTQKVIPKHLSSTPGHGS